MMRYILKIGIPVVVIAAIALAGLYVSNKPMQVYQVQPITSDKVFANVLAILPDIKHSHHLDKIDNGTMFLLMKTDNKLFYITSFKQIASFGNKEKRITDKSPIYQSLYIGRYSTKDNAIEYKSLDKAGVKSLLFEHRRTKNVEKAKLESEGIEFKVGINTGAFLVKYDDKKSKKLRIGSWPFSQKVINEVKLVPDSKNKVNTDIQHEVEKAKE